MSVSELQAGILDGTVTEAFGVGTAATIAPMAAISFDGQDLALPEVSGWRIAPRVSVELDAIRRGRIEDRIGWNIPVRPCASELQLPQWGSWWAACSALFRLKYTAYRSGRGRLPWRWQGITAHSAGIQQDLRSIRCSRT